MRVNVLFFGVLRDWMGTGETAFKIADGATVADLLRHLEALRSSSMMRGIAVSVNAEFAAQTKILQDGDEVALLPPVSGGCGDNESHAPESWPPEGKTLLVHAPIALEEAVRRAKQAEDGAVVVFDGIVRNHSQGRQTLFLDYEAYEAMAAKKLDELAQDARSRFGVRHVTILHRLGRLEIGESAVLIVVASGHRAAAYEASRWIIDSLKKVVPIWKKETFADGAVWADGDPFPDGVGIVSA